MHLATRNSKYVKKYGPLRMVNQKHAIRCIVRDASRSIELKVNILIHSAAQHATRSVLVAIVTVLLNVSQYKQQVLYHVYERELLYTVYCIILYGTIRYCMVIYSNASIHRNTNITICHSTVQYSTVLIVSSHFILLLFCDNITQRHAQALWTSTCTYSTAFYTIFVLYWYAISAVSVLFAYAETMVLLRILYCTVLCCVLEELQ
jgi:hypothetical protein